jgi:DNA-binding LacI/PurR family transcriptional regulator
MSIPRLDLKRAKDHAHWSASAKIVTIRDIARHLGVHHATISRALRNDRRLSRETIERVTSAAKELDYVPNPMLSALMAYRQES